MSWLEQNCIFPIPNRSKPRTELFNRITIFNFDPLWLPILLNIYEPHLYTVSVCKRVDQSVAGLVITRENEIKTKYSHLNSNSFSSFTLSLVGSSPFPESSIGLCCYCCCSSSTTTLHEPQEPQSFRGVSIIRNNYSSGKSINYIN